MNSITKFLLSIQEIDPGFAVLAFFSVFFWGYYLFLFHPEKTNKKLIIILIAMILGFISTKIILELHPLLWPEVNFKPKRVHIITQTAYIAFIQAGVMEETFKVLFIFLEGLFLGFSWKEKKWNKNIVLIGAFVALGFSFIENYIYIHKENQSTYSLLNIFIGRTIFSSNIHMLINLCFTLFLLKSNERIGAISKAYLILFAFLLAVVQHGVVDFFLIPSSRFGGWLAAALFIGIWVWVARDLRKYVFYSEMTIPDEPKLEEFSEKILTEFTPRFSEKFTLADNGVELYRPPLNEEKS